MAEKNTQNSSSPMPIYSWISLVTIIFFLILIGLQLAEFMFYNGIS